MNRTDDKKEQTELLKVLKLLLASSMVIAPKKDEVTFKIVDRFTNNIKFPISWNSITKLRVSQVSYTTASINNRFLIIDLAGFSNNMTAGGSYYFDTSVDKNYATPTGYLKCVFLPPISGGTILFLNDKDWDYSSTTPRDLSTGVNGRFLINDDTSLTDISPSNPLYITLQGY